jgi:archaellum component FlaC
MAPPVTRSSSDSQTSTTTSDPILQAINNRLISITQNLTDIRNDVTDLKITITGFKKEIPHTIEELTDEQRNYDERLDRLTLKIADTAVEFSEF